MSLLIIFLWGHYFVSNNDWQKFSIIIVLEPIYSIRSVRDFLQDYNRLSDIVENVDVQAFAYNRLRLLDHKFLLHGALNSLESGYV